MFVSAFVHMHVGIMQVCMCVCVERGGCVYECVCMCVCVLVGFSVCVSGVLYVCVCVHGVGVCVYVCGILVTYCRWIVLLVISCCIFFECDGIHRT